MSCQVATARTAAAPSAWAASDGCILCIGCRLAAAPALTVLWCLASAVFCAGCALMPYELSDALSLSVVIYT